jgi:Kef-type K+ transport system membrane component KefB
MGLAYKAINEAEFGVAVMMTFVTTFLAPIALMPLFRNPRSGVREKEAVIRE